MNAFERYSQANARLESLLVEDRGPGGGLSGARLVAATRELLDRCGAPDQSLECVLVGGTSGKGSTALALAALLKEVVPTGLYTNPYLQVATEKVWLDGLYLEGDEFCALVDWLWPRLVEFPGIGYRAVSLVLAVEAMRRHGIRVGIFEASCGGRFDPVNALEARAVAITTVGLDHVALLGPSLQDIAWHKAGLIKSTAPVVTGVRGRPLWVVLEEARHWNAPVEVVQPGDSSLAQGLARTLFKHLRGTGPPQVGPDALASLPGRLEVMGERGLVLLDGAHNSEKTAHLARELAGFRAVVVFGALAGKSHRPMFKILSRLARALVLTPLAVTGREGAPVEELSQEARGLFEVELQARSPGHALALALGCRLSDEVVLVTGSLYLVGQLRSRWYPAERVLEARHSWPD